MDIHPYLKLMVEKNASDLFFSVGAPVNIKIEGVSQPINPGQVLAPDVVKAQARSLMTEDQAREFEARKEMNLAISVPDIGRFRVNVYMQRGEVAMVVRYIKSTIPSVDQLGLPKLLEQLVMETRGLVLLVGSTGSGKSTTLAAMIDYRNRHATGHILCIEDPIEYVHQHNKSVVDQREVGIDTDSYSVALKNAMREAPDLIMIGEIRDRETMQQAIAYAETGHLCLSTMHANNANQAIDRIINFFPEDARNQLLLDLSLNLKAVISQRLITGVAGKRVPAVEVLLNSPYVSDLIHKGKVDEIRPVMARNRDQGMCTFDQSLFELFRAGKIDEEEALRNADSRNDLGLQIRLSSGRIPSIDGLALGGGDLEET
jgi:twitching motility protein PilU